MDQENNFVPDPDAIKQNDYNEILSRIKHIKSLFAFGEGILPFLEELFIFLKEVSPMLNELSDSIMNTTGMMPDAAVELESAVAQTSDATYRIMDRVEHILEQIDALEKQIEEGKDVSKEFSELRNDAHTIMNALQFLDIVSQKLVHVRRVLAEIQQKMLNLFTRVYEMHIEDDVKENILATFGVNVAEFQRLMETKINVDNKMTDDSDAPEDLKKKEKEEKKKEEETDKPNAADFSQSDIDDLFG